MIHPAIVDEPTNIMGEILIAYPKKPDNKESSDSQWIKQVGVYSLIPFIIGVSPIIGWLVGSWLDEKLSTHPYLMYIGILLGCGAAFREVYRIITRFGDGE